MLVNDNTISMNIKGVDYTINRIPKKRTIYIFEKISGKYFSELNDSHTDAMMLLFSVLSANNREKFNFNFDQFMDILDETDDDKIKIFSDFVTEGQEEKSEKVDKPQTKKKAKNN